VTTPSKHPRNDRMLTVEQLRQKITAEEIDTVVLAFTDMQGRLQGKLCHGQFFLDSMLDEGAEGCNYLLAVDTEMNTPGGYAISSWDSGYGDMSFAMDLDTIRLMPHNPGQVLIQCDLTGHDGQLIPMSPRAMLHRQLDHARDMGYQMLTGTELEFCVYNTSYESAWEANYQNLEPANKYNVDYNILGSQRVEPLIREIRNSMYAAGMTVESAKGECNLGQHEIAFRFDEGLVTADNHVVYKLASKQIAHQQGKSITFMAKPNQREGSSCHIHMSLRGLNGELSFWDQERGDRSATYDWFIAGVLHGMRELSIFYAPTINSYKRFAKGSFAPTAVAWGIDNRSCAVRLVGTGQSARMENRLPGGDVNPYLALSAMLASGLYGIEHQLPLEPMMEGNAYESEAQIVPSTMREARDLLAGSQLAREMFGADVVEHYLHYADVELEAFESAVTDWELHRGFERL
jgi:glutamine synthetase